MNEQYITLIGKVCSPRYEEVYTPEVKSKLPIEASSEGRKLKDYTIYGNNNPNHVDESQSILPVNIDTYGGNAVDWEIFGNNNPVVETKNGNLPLELTSSAGNVIDYTIYGNNNCNKNLLEITAESQTINGVTFTVDKQAGIITVNGTATANARLEIGTIDIIANNQYNLSGNIETPSTIADRICSLYVYSHSDLGIDYGDGVVLKPVETDIPGAKIAFMVYRDKTVENAIIRPMLRPADTSPNFEPYQIGVGENTEVKSVLPIEFRSNGDDLLGYKIYGTTEGAGETENLFNKNANDTNNGYVSGCYLTVDNRELANEYYVISEYIQIQPSTTYYLSNVIGSGSATALCFYNANKEYISSVKLYVSGTRTTEVTSPDDAVFLRTTIQVYNGYIDTAMITKTETAEYIPFEYKIPLTVTSGTESKATDVYIGDSKLGEAEYVDYGEQKIYRRILFMTYNDKHFMTKDNKDFCLRRRGYSG